MKAVSFGEKLNFLKTQFQVSDREIGDYVGAVASLVCRWRNGERTLDKDDDVFAVKKLSLFFVERAVLKRQCSKLAEILSLDEKDVDTGNAVCVNRLADFLFDGQPGREVETSKIPAAPVRNIPNNYIGVQGVVDALGWLEEQLKVRPETEITVYLSLEFSRLLQDEIASGIWESLYRMNGNQSVKVVFDGWVDNAEKVTQNLKALLPFMQTGKIQLHMIKSTQKFFYHNLTFFAKGAGMVITTEPAGGMGVSISLMVDSPDYLNGMGTVLSDFDRRAKSLARLIGGTKDEAVYYGQLLEPSEDLQILTGGLNILYMDAESYLSLLKLNGITGSQRQYRHTRFMELKQRFEVFLKEHRIKEIISLPALDYMIAEQKIITPDISFHDGEIKTDVKILQSLINGLLGYIERYENLTVYLERDPNINQGFTCRIKGDTFILLHTRENGKNHTVYSDNWMLVYEYIKQFNEVLQSEQLMNIKNAVKAALQLRLERLGGA